MLKAEGPKINVLTHSPKLLVLCQEQNILAVSGGEPDYGWDV